MAYRIEKGISGEPEIVIDGWEKGIAISPHKGIASIQSGNISTEPGEVMANYNRAQQSQTGSTATGSLTASTTVDLLATISGVSVFRAGIPITISGSTITGLADGNYYIVSAISNALRVSTTLGGSPVVFTASGTASFTFIRNMSKPIAHASEIYSDGTNTQYRYFILDNQGLVWVYDTATADSSIGLSWFLPDTSLISNATGIEVLNGWVMVFALNNINCKSTVQLGTSPGWTNFASGSTINRLSPHFAYVGRQGKLYYTDGNFVGSIFPNTSLLTGASNMQSYAKYTASTTTGTISVLISGNTPTFAAASSARVPAAFFSTGTKPTALTTGTIYYIQYNLSSNNFEVYSAISGGAALDIETGSSGAQYFNTFYPTSTSGKQTITFTPQKFNLPVFETAQSMAELGNEIIIGTNNNTLYPWNQIDVLPSTLISLPENNVVNMITVNNMVYVFAGSRGNIYLTNGSTASVVLKVPDYCAGIAGSPQTYVEPFFTWGDAMYLRGKVYFSIQDQYASSSTPVYPAKAGNCGGIWSFVPTQNFFYGQDTGLSLMLENRSSYGTYNGACSVLIPAYTQTSRGPQYWSGWYSNITSATYGIDYNDGTISTPCVIETDLIPTGTMLNKQTFSQIEYKLSSPLQTGATISIKYRQNSTDEFTSCGSVISEGDDGLSGYFSVNFEKGQWVQLQITLNPNGGGSTANYVRLRKVIIR